MKVIEIKCPNCSAQLKTSSDRRMLFCEYCGTRIILDDGVVRSEHTENININNTQKHVNEAKLQRLEYEREIRNQKLEEEKKKKESAKRFGIVFSIVLVIAIAFGSLAYYMNQNKSIKKMNQQIENGLINIGYSSSSLRGRNYKTVKANLEALGFTNIELINLNDRGLGDMIFGNSSKEENTIARISVNGIESFSKYDCFNADDQIIISYHY